METPQLDKLRLKRNNSTHNLSRLYGTAQVPFEAMYDFSRQAVFSHALYMLRKRAVAEDIVQEVFLYAWINSEKFDENRSNLQSWLLMLCRSRVIDYMRVQAATSRFNFNESKESKFSPDEVAPDFLCEKKIRNKAIKLAIESLASTQREVIVLNYYRELSQSEIANYLGKPLGSVKTLIRRAKIQLSCNSKLMEL